MAEAAPVSPVGYVGQPEDGVRELAKVKLTESASEIMVPRFDDGVVR